MFKINNKGKNSTLRNPNLPLLSPSASRRDKCDRSQLLLSRLPLSYIFFTRRMTPVIPSNAPPIISTLFDNTLLIQKHHAIISSRRHTHKILHLSIRHHHNRTSPRSCSIHHISQRFQHLIRPLQPMILSCVNRTKNRLL